MGGCDTSAVWREREEERREKNTVYLMHTDKKKGCITSVNTSSQPPSSNESQTKAYTNSGPCLCWREKKEGNALRVYKNLFFFFQADAVFSNLKDDVTRG